ncbi:MAG: hypothetical protein EP347_02560 [Alphaproteobacteria bacterium]|nr:MAG: hypothetical protein EP347_02560 [Alphaproteobacteria bacterium]
MTVKRFTLAAAILAFAFPSSQAQVTTPSGTPSRSDISGKRGDDIETIDLSRGKGVIAISGDANSMGTCRIKTEGKRLGQNADLETHTAGHCLPSTSEVFSADARYGYYITSLRVCTSRAPHEMVTGIEIESRIVDNASGPGDFAPSERDWGRHCDRWHRWSSCDPGEVVVGLDVHITEPPEETFGGNGYVTGITALCQEVIAKP